MFSLRFTREYKKKVETARAKMSAIQRKQKETEKIASFSSQNTKKYDLCGGHIIYIKILFFCELEKNYAFIINQVMLLSTVTQLFSVKLISKFW